MSTKGYKHRLSRHENHLNDEIKITYNKDSGETVRMSNGSQENNRIENGLEATNPNSETAYTATMDEFRRDGVVMMVKTEENGMLNGV